MQATTVGISEGDSLGAIFRADYLSGDSGGLVKYGRILFLENNI